MKLSAQSILRVLAATLGITLICFTAKAETLIVPATTPNGVWSSPLTAGKMYLVTASGVATNYNGAGYFDAEWQTQPNSTIWEEYDSTSDGSTGGAWTGQRDIMDIFINDVGVDWLGSIDGTNWSAHTYSPSHVYRQYIVGNGSAVKFHVADPRPIQPVDWYSDNAGSLTVQVTAIPELSGFLTLLCGIGAAGAKLRRRRE
jgi:hypothetical protein